MRITKFGHACVRISNDDVTLVLDPGGFTEAEAVDGATAVLITHEHADHLDVANLRASDAPIWTIGAVARAIEAEAPDVAERVTVVRPGDEFEVSGVGVRAVGEKHAVIHPDYDRFDNSGYLLEVDGSKVFHPGDALTGPGEAIDLLLAPICAPWMKVSEGIDFAREVGAPRNLAIHDRVYSDAGLGMATTHFTRLLHARDQEFTRLRDGADFG